jgi:hypothetical protein
MTFLVGQQLAKTTARSLKLCREVDWDRVSAIGYH